MPDRLGVAVLGVEGGEVMAVLEVAMMAGAYSTTVEKNRFFDALLSPGAVA